MNGKNRPLVTDEPVEVQDFKENDCRSFERNLENIPQVIKEKPEDVNV